MMLLNGNNKLLKLKPYIAILRGILLILFYEHNSTGTLNAKLCRVHGTNNIQNIHTSTKMNHLETSRSVPYTTTTAIS